MRAVQLDFQRVQRPLPCLGLVLLLAALAVLAALAGWYRALDQQVRFWEGRAEAAARLSTQRTAAARPLTEAAARTQLLEVKQANQVVRQLGLPWNELLNAVESTGDLKVALLSLEPDLPKGNVKIAGEARDLDTLLAYVRELSTREVFGLVMLQNHQIQLDVAERPVRFSLVAQWKGVAP